MVADRYSQKYESLIEQEEVSCINIASNLVAALKANAHLISKGMTEYNKSFATNLRATRDYFRMLEDFPEFKKGEISSADGCFPDLYEKASDLKSKEEQIKLFGKAPAFHNHYVHLSKQRLRE